MNYSAEPQAGVGSRLLPAVLRNSRMLELIAGGEYVSTTRPCRNRLRHLPHPISKVLFKAFDFGVWQFVSVSDDIARPL